MPRNKGNLAQLFSIFLFFIIINFSSALAQETEEPEFSIKISQGFSLIIDGRELLSKESYSQSVISLDYLEFTAGHFFNGNEIGFSIGKNSFYSDYTRWESISIENGIPTDTTYVRGIAYTTGNWIGMYYSREILKNLKLGINISIPLDGNGNTNFYTQYFLDKEINFKNNLYLNIHLAYGALNRRIFDFDNYNSNQLILAFGINFKL